MSDRAQTKAQMSSKTKESLNTVTGPKRVVSRVESDRLNAAPPSPVPTPQPQPCDIGVIVHWGIYAVPAFDSIASAKRRNIQNGSEWYLKRLSTPADGGFRPTSGWKETKEFHKKTYGDNYPYADFAKEFTADALDLDQWMTIFKSMGARYAVLTAKHHDGFCLWPTKTTKFNAVDGAPAKRDLVGKSLSNILILSSLGWRISQRVPSPQPRIWYLLFVG